MEPWFQYSEVGEGTDLVGTLLSSLSGSLRPFVAGLISTRDIRVCSYGVKFLRESKAGFSAR